MSITKLLAWHFGYQILLEICDGCFCKTGELKWTSTFMGNFDRSNFEWKQFLLSVDQ